MNHDNFDIAMAFVAQHEGGRVNDPTDRGGSTAFGISLRFMQLIGEDIDGDGHITAADVDLLTTDRAEAIYHEHFWLRYRLDEIKHPFIAAKAMDIFVNMRGQTAARCLQRSVHVTVDGILGSKSIKAINDQGNTGSLYAQISRHQAEIYRRIVENDSTQTRFIRGWLRRANR